MLNHKSLAKAMEVFQALLIGEEISLETGKNAEYYESYNNNAEVNEIVEQMAKGMNLKIYDYNYSLFLTAGDHNRVLGYTNEELKRAMGLRLNKELYLCYFIMYNIMVSFYSDSATYTYTEYVRIEEVLEAVSRNLSNMISNINLLVRNELEESSFETLALTFDELPVVSSEDTNGIRAGRGSKSGYVKLVFNFLISQNLFVEAQEKYYPTDRFHAMVKAYFEEERGRLYEMQQQLEEKEGQQDATY